MSKFCGKRSLCPVGKEHAEACARAERETWGGSASHQAARAAWRTHSAVCKAPNPDRSHEELRAAYLANAQANRTTFDGNGRLMFGENDEAFPSAEEWSRVLASR